MAVAPRGSYSQHRTFHHASAEGAGYSEHANKLTGGQSMGLEGVGTSEATLGLVLMAVACAIYIYALIKLGLCRNGPRRGVLRPLRECASSPICNRSSQ